MKKLKVRTESVVICDQDFHTHYRVYYEGDKPSYFMSVQHGHENYFGHLFLHLVAQRIKENGQSTYELEQIALHKIQ